MVFRLIFYQITWASREIVPCLTSPVGTNSKVDGFTNPVASVILAQ